MDWVQFLEEYSIPYTTRGPNTKKGEVSVKCPFCGEADPSQHLGISLTRERWGCLRDGQHRGRLAHTLIQALLGCSWGQAKLIAGQHSVVDPDGLDDPLPAFGLTSEAPRASIRPLDAPPSHAIAPTGLTTRFWRYIEGRGFDSPQVKTVIRQYGLTACLIGRFKDRVIIPFYQQGELIGWTGRALVNPILAPRYLSSGEAVKRTVFNEDELQLGGDTLIVCEGPFDAIKLDFFGLPQGIRATCAFGISFTTDQLYILSMLRKKFKRLVILMDQEAIGPAFDAADWLCGPNVTIGSLPEGTKDPGEMSRIAVKQLLKEL